MELPFLLWLCLAAALDVVKRKCPNWIIISGLGLIFISLILGSEIKSIDVNIYERILGFVFAFFFLIFFYIRGMMGAGDVKFAAVLGFWLGWKILVPIWLISCIFAIAHGFIAKNNLRYIFFQIATLNVGSQIKGEKFIPYVTYLSIATVVVLMLGK